MDTDATTDTERLATELAEPWDAFIALTADHRPELFAFGLRLTGSPFDGEDLVQDALIRAFGAAAMHAGSIRNLRSYLFRTMSNLWIDHHRRQLPEPIADLDDASADETTDPGEVRDASEQVLALPVRERVAVVMHEGFGFTHAEIAEMVGTTEGAIRTALHRARARLADPPVRTTAHVDRDVLEEFVAAFGRADVDAIRGLLTGDVTSTVFPCPVGRGADHAMADGWVTGSLYHHHPDHEPTRTPFPSRLHVVEIASRPVVAVERGGPEGMLVEEVWAFGTTDGRIAEIDDYCFCPDLVAHVARELGLAVRSLGYRFDDRLAVQTPVAEW